MRDWEERTWIRDPVQLASADTFNNVKLPGTRLVQSMAAVEPIRKNRFFESIEVRSQVCSKACFLCGGLRCWVCQPPSGCIVIHLRGKSNSYHWYQKQMLSVIMHIFFIFFLHMIKVIYTNKFDVLPNSQSLHSMKTQQYLLWAYCYNIATAVFLHNSIIVDTHRENIDL